MVESWSQKTPDYIKRVYGEFLARLKRSTSALSPVWPPLLGVLGSLGLWPSPPHHPPCSPPAKRGAVLLAEHRMDLLVLWPSAAEICALGRGSVTESTAWPQSLDGNTSLSHAALTLS